MHWIKTIFSSKDRIHGCTNALKPEFKNAPTGLPGEVRAIFKKITLKHDTEKKIDGDIWISIRLTKMMSG
jgi:hypothetical protein